MPFTSMRSPGDMTSRAIIGLSLSALLVVSGLEPLARGQSGGTFTIQQSVIAGGGVGGDGTSTGGTYRLDGTIGQSAAGTLEQFVDGNQPPIIAYSHVAGFWYGIAGIPAAGYEGDADGNGSVNSIDVIKIRRLSIGLDTPTDSAQFARADCSPRSTSGDGAINSLDVIQARRYSILLDPLQVMGGPFGPGGGPFGPAAQPIDTDSQAATIPGPHADLPNTPNIARVLSLRMGSDNAPGHHSRLIEVLVELETHGGEGALTFSLNFDPASLQQPRVMLGRDVGSALLMVNQRDAAQGRLGVLVELPPGLEMRSGLKEIARITFVAGHPDLKGGTAESANNDVHLSFADRPAMRSLSNTDAEALRVIYQDMPNARDTVAKKTGIEIRDNLQ